MILQGAFDYCATLGGILPSADFFDVNKFQESPRSSNTTEETNDTEDEDYYYYEVSENEIDTGVDFVDENGVEKSRRRTLQVQRRSKRQILSGGGFWYWLNNFNDGRICYAALPGDVVRFRAFPCTDLLRVICQLGPDDKRPLLKPRLPQPPKERVLPIQEPLDNQVPDAIIRANPKEPLFARNGLSNPYLNYHAKVLQQRKQNQQQRSKKAQQIVQRPFGARQRLAAYNLAGIRILFGI